MDIYQELIGHVEEATDEPLDRVRQATDLRETSDRVMDHFVGQAREAGESWTAIGDLLGVSKQAARKRFADRVQTIRPRLQACLAQAEREARAEGVPEIQTQHLLAGLFAEGVAAAILEKLGLTADKVRESSRRLFEPRAGASDDVSPEMSAEARGAMNEATRLARTGGGQRVGTEHLLAALVMDPGSRSRRVVNDLGLDIAVFKRELDCFVGHRPPRRRRRGRKFQADETCSFCGRGAAEAGQLVAGPGVWICADCVDLATEILADSPRTATSQ